MLTPEDALQDSRIVAILKRVVEIWSVALVVIVIVADTFELFELRPGGSLFATRIRWVFLGLFVLAVLVARFSELIGGAIGIFTVVGLSFMVYDYLQPVNATIVVFGFLVPALVWLAIGVLERKPNHDMARRRMLAAPLVIVAGIAGWRVAAYFNDRFFGPTHPESPITAMPSGPTKWIWTGAVTTESATVVAQLKSQSVEDVVLRYAAALDADSEALRSELAGSHSPMIEGDVMRFDLAELDPTQRYVCALEIDGEIDDTSIAEFTTFPDGAASFTMAFGACARTGSNGTVFDTIRELEPAVFVTLGDFNYGDVLAPDLDQRRDVMEHTLTRPAQAALHRSTPMAYVWDDHDFGGNDAHRFAASRSAAMSVYRQYVPHYPLAGTFSTIHQAFSIGRVRVIMTDARSGRTPTPPGQDNITLTMLGREQLDWLLDELEVASATHAAVVWVNPVPWVAEEDAASDNWGGYVQERARIAEHIESFGIRNLVMVSGDAHMVAIDDGTHTNYALSSEPGFPLLHASPLDRPGSIKGGPYTQGPITDGGQFGLVEVQDSGREDITLRLRAMNWQGTELLSHEVTFDATQIVTDS